MSRWKLATVIVAVTGPWASVALAQGFIEAVEDQGLIINNKVIATLTDGQEVTAKLDKATFMMGALKSFTFEDEAGNKTKYKADDVERMRVKVDKMMRFALQMSGDSISDMAGKDWEEVAEREYVIYERAVMPGKKAKRRLLQLVNPGWDDPIKVYYNPNPNAKKSSGFMGFTGGDPLTYLMVKDGTQAIKVEKDGFKKTGFEELFGDCPEMLAAYPDKKSREWEYVAEHVFVYNQQCKP